ncbi:MAG: hypothetical protein IKT21_00515, partial [Methanomicrobium sp.]|nr:hypothetical protein [Methanomicrobium sp.]
MSDETGDDIIRNIAKVVENILENLQKEGNTRFIGCTVISGPDGEPRIFSRDIPGGRVKADSRELEYEIVEGEDVVYITVEVPFDISDMPRIDVSGRSVHLGFELIDYNLDLPCAVRSSGITKHLSNGVLDIVCAKEPVFFDEDC